MQGLFIFPFGKLTELHFNIQSHNCAIGFSEDATIFAEGPERKKIIGTDNGNFWVRDFLWGGGRQIGPSSRGSEGRKKSPHRRDLQLLHHL